MIQNDPAAVEWLESREEDYNLYNAHAIYPLMLIDDETGFPAALLTFTDPNEQKTLYGWEWLYDVREKKDVQVSSVDCGPERES